MGSPGRLGEVGGRSTDTALGPPHPHHPHDHDARLETLRPAHAAAVAGM
ncbi:hypothetical protein KPATCC21470_4883 [Kitasatospora purpeofusca]